MKKEQLYKLLLDFRLWRPPTMETLVKKIGYSGNKGLISSFKSLEKEGRVYKKGRYYYPVFKKEEAIFDGTSPMSLIK